MSQSVPAQHPAVVMRSHYVHLRALLAAAMIAVIGLTVALVIVASNGGASTARLATPANASTPSVYNGGHEEGLAGPGSTNRPNVRYDGGPEEGTSGH